MTEILGGIVLAAWAAFVLWGIVEIVGSAIRRDQWAPSFYAVGLIGACAIGAGSVMTLRAMLPDVFGLGFLRAADWRSGPSVTRRRGDDRGPTP
jgi:hypothetical protein